MQSQTDKTQQTSEVLNNVLIHKLVQGAQRVT